MAAPHVAGIVAQILQARPDLTPSAVTAQLLAAATPGKIIDRGPRSPNLLAYEAMPPRQPTAVRTSKSDRTASATISWTAPKDQGTSPITAYKITRDGTDNQLRGADDGHRAGLPPLGRAHPAAGQPDLSPDGAGREPGSAPDRWSGPP